MNREELFKKYRVKETHNKWEQIDSLMAIEIYRIMHDGQLPKENDLSLKYLTQFLDRCNSDIKFVSSLMERVTGDFGNLYLTAKRMIYKFADLIIEQS